MEMDEQINNLKVVVKVTSSSEMAAMITLDFGWFKVKGFRVRKSEYQNRRGESLWLTPPAYQAGGGYHPIFFVERKENWEKLEDKIYDAFNEALIVQSLNEKHS